MKVSQAAVNAIIENRTVYDDLDQPRWMSWDGVFDDFEAMIGDTYKAFQMVDFYCAHGDQPEWLDQVA